MAAVLLIDDYEPYRHCLACCLAAQGLVVHEADDASRALEQLRAGGFGAVVLDWVLPGGDGEGFLTELARVTGPRPPVLVVTVLADPRVEQTARALGAIGVEVKGARSIQDLARRIAALVASRSAA